MLKAGFVLRKRSSEMAHLRLLPLYICLAAGAAHGQGGTVKLAELPDDSTLLKELFQRSPDLVNARARVAAAQADVERVQRYPNPGLDFSVNTVPVGPTNPPDLPNPLANVPNYNVGVSELFELGKRGPRQAAMREAMEATREDALATARDKLYDFLEAAGEVAAEEEKVAALQRLVDDAQALTELTRARVQKGDAAALELDRTSLEEEKLRSTLAAEREALGAALVSCSRVAGATCEPFGSSEKAEAFLHARTRLENEDVAALQQRVPERPDLKALEAQRRVNEELVSLAHARTLPDPTFRLGYTRDQFVTAGNQRDSVQLLVSIPLPLFEHGQSDVKQASAAAAAADRTRTIQLERAQADLTRLVEQTRLANERRVSMHEKTLPLARGVVERLEQAVRVGGAAVTDLLVARRLYGDILSDAAELDLTTLRFSLEVARASGQGPDVDDGTLLEPL